MKGMKIKPGSLGKAAPPYDVQVRWFLFLLAAHFTGSETQQSAANCPSVSTIWWYSGQAALSGGAVGSRLVLAHGSHKSCNRPFVLPTADYRWKRQRSASRARRRHRYQNGCHAAVYFFHSILGKSRVSLQRASGGLQRGTYSNQQEPRQQATAVALPDVTVCRLAKLPFSPPFFRRPTVRFPVLCLPLW